MCKIGIHGSQYVQRYSYWCSEDVYEISIEPRLYPLNCSYKEKVILTKKKSVICVKSLLADLKEKRKYWRNIFKQAMQKLIRNSFYHVFSFLLFHIITESSILCIHLHDISTFAKVNFFQMLIVILVLSFVLTLKHTYL